jgi:prefoldin subunit 5
MGVGEVVGVAVGLAGLGAIIFQLGSWYANTKSDQRTVERLESAVEEIKHKVDDQGVKLDNLIHRITHVERTMVMR